MAFVPLKRRRTTKPEPGVGIDWSNKLTDGLVLAYYFNEKGDVVPFDHAKRFKTASDPTAGAYATVTTTEGKAKDFTASTGLLADTYDLSDGFCAIGRLSHDTGTTDQALFGHSAATERIFCWRDEFASGDRYGIGCADSGGTNQIVYSGTKSDLNRFYTVGFNSTATTATSGTHSIYVDGKFENSTTGDLHSEYSSIAVRLGAAKQFASPSRQLDGKISFFLLFDRPKTAAEIRALSENPYQILQPPTQYIETTAAAATTNTIVPIRRPQTKQPQQPVIDWSNPLTRGLIIANTGHSKKNLVDGSAAAHDSNTTLSTGPDGKVVDISSGHLVWNTSTSTDLPATIMARAKYGSTDVWGGLFNTSIRGGLYLNYESGAFTFWTQSGFRAAAWTTTPVTGKSYTLAGVARSNSDRELFVDGVSRATNTVASNTGTMSEGAYGYRDGTTGPVNHNYDDMAFFFAWNRALTDAEVKTLSDNPWQIFQPQTQYIEIGTAAAPVGATGKSNPLYGPLGGPLYGAIA